jgi:hypothetical protein
LHRYSTEANPNGKIPALMDHSEGGESGGGGEALINRSAYEVKPFYLSSETVLPIE